MNCQKQFFQNNRMNYVMTIVMQTIFSAVSISISFLMMLTIESIEFTDTKRLKQAGVLLVIILVVYAASGYIQKIFRNRFLKKALYQFKSYIFERLLKKSIKEFKQGSSGTIINAFSNDLNSIELHYLNGSIELVQQIIMFVMALIAMYWLNWILATCVILSCIIPIAFSVSLGRHLASKEIKTSDEGESFVDQVKDLLNGFVLIKSFNAEREVLDLFKKKNVSLEEAKRDRRDTNDSVKLASTYSRILVISMIFSIGLYMAFKNIISIGGIIAFTELSHYATGPVELIFPLRSNRKAAIGLISKISTVVDSGENIEKKMPIDEKNTTIAMQNVSFSYNGEKQVLNDINITFEEGKNYAIVGGSGCGKSTLTQLILGYYDDYQGEILIGDRRLRNIDLDSLYNVISIIQQNVFLFDSNIEDNITMFKEFPQENIQRAITLAGLKQLIAEKGVNYQSGEGGKNLSGGEKQRISIARCLLRETPVIIMDEATAALDNKTAFEVENAILDLKGLTKIIVTHKYNQAIMRKYDKIIVLRDGRIEEQGTFDELINKKNYFYSLYNVAGE